MQFNGIPFQGKVKKNRAITMRLHGTRGGFHGLATGHLDDVSFINIQPVIKAAWIERSEEVEKGKNRRKIDREIEEEDYVKREKKQILYKSCST